MVNEKTSRLPPVLFLMGPTASGKTELAMALCEHLPVEIISVDSALVYRGMDIGSAKPTPEERMRVPHWLIDIRDPAQPYSAADFRQDALEAMAAITAKGGIPLLVGGTMLYFKALLEGLANMPSGDARIRAEIEAQAAQHGWPYVHALLAQVDPQAAARIHPNHSQRLSRALEIYRLSGTTMTELCREQSKAGAMPLKDLYNPLQLAITPRNRSILHRRINQRFDRMLEQGLIEEVTQLFQRGDLHGDMPALRAVGYRQVWEYLAGETTREQMIERGKAATRQLAKRQLTWLRGWRDLHWIYTDSESGSALKLDEIVAQSLNFMSETAI